MIANKRIFRPIRTLGIIIGFSGFFALLSLLSMWNETHFSLGGKAFMVVISIWQLLTGLGVILRKPWGYYLLKSTLYVLYVGWPFGTLLAKWIFQYIEKNEIKVFFFNKVMEV